PSPLPPCQQCRHCERSKAIPNRQCSDCYGLLRSCLPRNDATLWVSKVEYKITLFPPYLNNKTTLVESKVN
ncbi:MAG: hypothetical protein LBE13_17985, partial [Bacteroidales bacterium]|nr:hypothetical protein [Bacteroidales bacterium]